VSRLLNAGSASAWALGAAKLEAANGAPDVPLDRASLPHEPWRRLRAEVTDAHVDLAFRARALQRMLVDIVNPGWAPIYIANLTEDIPGYVEAPANALAYSWKHFIGGHNGRLGTRDDVTLHQQYMADIAESSRKAIDTVDPTRYFVKYGENSWAAVKGYLDEVTAVAAAPVIEKYTGVLAAADVFTESTTFWVMESIRLDLGYGSQVHP
jgi:hypothetical protein